MHVCVAEYNAMLDGDMTPEEKTQVMGDNILRLLAVHLQTRLLPFDARHALTSPGGPVRLHLLWLASTDR